MAHIHAFYHKKAAQTHVVYLAFHNVVGYMLDDDKLHDLVHRKTTKLVAVICHMDD